MGLDHTDTPDAAAPPVPAREGTPPPPTPVRASLAAEKGGTASDGGPGTDVVLEADGVRWVVDVAGMTRSGAASASAPILLLRFRPQDGQEESSREAWVVGRSLAALTELQVEAAFRESERSEPSWTGKPLFPEAGSRGGKDG